METLWAAQLPHINRRMAPIGRLVQKKQTLKILLSMVKYIMHNFSDIAASQALFMAEKYMCTPEVLASK